MTSKYQEDPYFFEDCIFWLVPFAALKGVRIREKTVITARRRGDPECGYEIVAYSNLYSFSPNIGTPGEYYRRVFVKDDTGYLPDGVYAGIRLERDSLI
jgi:hypothetical protein